MPASAMNWSNVSTDDKENSENKPISPIQRLRANMKGVSSISVNKPRAAAFQPKCYTPGTLDKLNSVFSPRGSVLNDAEVNVIHPAEDLSESEIAKLEALVFSPRPMRREMNKEVGKRRNSIKTAANSPSPQTMRMLLGMLSPRPERFDELEGLSVE